MAFIIGVTGGIGSGKTAATHIFASLGVEVIDADVIARAVVAKGSPALASIVQHFGSSVLLSNGELNRKILREKIFTPYSDDKIQAENSNKIWLENLLHPLVRKQIHTDLNHIQSVYGVLSSPLLFETRQHELVNRTLVIDCPTSLQIARTVARDNSTSDNIQNIINTQLTRDARNHQADDIIDNSGDLHELQRAITDYHTALIHYLKKNSAQDNQHD